MTETEWWCFSDPLPRMPPVLFASITHPPPQQISFLHLTLLDPVLGPSLIHSLTPHICKSASTCWILCSALREQDGQRPSLPELREGGVRTPHPPLATSEVSTLTSGNDHL